MIEELRKINQLFLVSSLKELNLKFNPNHVQSGENGGQFTSGPEPTKEEISNAVATYQSTLFDAINNELRYDKPDKYKEIIKLLDKASVDNTTDDLFRGLDSNFTKQLSQKYGIKDFSNLSELKEKLVGKVLKDKAFMSATRSLKVAGDFARNMGTGRTTVMQIGGSKRGIEVSKHVSNLRARIEREFLIKRGSSVTIKDVGLSKTGKLILYTNIN